MSDPDTAASESLGVDLWAMIMSMDMARACLQCNSILMLTRIYRRVRVAGIVSIKLDGVWQCWRLLAAAVSASLSEAESRLLLPGRWPKRRRRPRSDLGPERLRRSDSDSESAPTAAAAGSNPFAQPGVAGAFDSD